MGLKKMWDVAFDMSQRPSRSTRNISFDFMLNPLSESYQTAPDSTLYVEQDLRKKFASSMPIVAENPSLIYRKWGK